MGIKIVIKKKGLETYSQGEMDDTLIALQTPQDCCKIVAVTKQHRFTPNQIKSTNKTH